MIGTMLADCTAYPFSCDPDDIVLAMKRNRMEYFFADVQFQGEYPQYALNYFEENNIHIEITEEDKAILQKYHGLSSAFLLLFTNGRFQKK